MPIQIKVGGAYAAPIAVSVKKNGVYTSVVGLFAKADGVYQSVLNSGVTGVLRAASPFNRMPSSLFATSATYATRVSFRVVHIIGSGDRSDLSIVLNNFAPNFSNQIVDGFSALTYSSLYLEANGTTTPILFGGSATRVLSTTDYDIASDSVLPSAVGLSAFAQGSKVWVRGFIDVPMGGKIPLIHSNVGDSDDAMGRQYDPAVTTCTNIAATGVMAFAGTGPSGIGVPSVILVGRFVTGDPTTMLGVGDSIMYGYNDTTGPNAKLGYGWFPRALYNAGTNVVAGINCGVSGTTGPLWSGSARLNSLVKYCSTALYEYGDNSFLSNANSTTELNAVIATDRAIWTQIRANASKAPGVRTFKILGVTMLPRVVFSPNDANQVAYGVKWEVGGDVDLFNTSRAADVGVAGRIDAVYWPVWSRQSADVGTLEYHRWALGMSSDAQHLNSAGQAAYAAGLRPSIDAL